MCRCGQIARAVLIFLGVPLVAGYLTRRSGRGPPWRVWYEERFLPRIGPVALWGLLFTVVMLFALQGDKITHSPFDVARIAVPLLAYFGIMWTGAFVSVDAAAVRLSALGERRVHRRGQQLRARASRWPSACSASLPARPSPVSSARSSRCPCSSALVYVALWARRRFFPQEEST